MKRYILTGAPGAGKTVLLRRLELAGVAVVEEAATDLIALATARGALRHWQAPAFIDDILALQVARQRRADTWQDEVVVFDRSPVCTWALCEFLGRPPPPALVRELERIGRERIYEPDVFFVESLGFITPTEARRIRLEDSLRFGAIHRAAYAHFGFTCVGVPAAEVEARSKLVLERLARG